MVARLRIRSMSGDRTGSKQVTFGLILVPCVLLISTATPMLQCCSCNGKNAVCRRCMCAHAGRPCSSCLPMKIRRCVNTGAQGADSQPAMSSAGEVCTKKNNPAALQPLPASVNLSPGSERYVLCASDSDVCDTQNEPPVLHGNNTATATLCNSSDSLGTGPAICDPFSLGFYESNSFCYDDLMRRAYGSVPPRSEGGDPSCVWHA